MDFIFFTIRIRITITNHRSLSFNTPYEFICGTDLGPSYYYQFENRKKSCDFTMQYFLKLCFYHGLKPWEVLQQVLEPIWQKKK